MSGHARALILALGLLAIIGGTGLAIVTGGGGIPLLIVGLLTLASVGLEQRYGRQGRQRSIPHSDWQLTEERFFDDETGQPVEVWVDPLTGERRYEPLGDHPRIADPRTHRRGTR
jgi:hypothetical protein